MEKVDFYAPNTDAYVLFDDVGKVKGATFPKLIAIFTDAKGVGNNPSRYHFD